MVKTPKEKQCGRLQRIHDGLSLEEALEHIASCQEELSHKLSTVLPAYRVGKKIYMPRAPGVRCTEIPDKWTWIQGIVRKEYMKIKELGFVALDLGSENVFWDGGSIYMIDFHAIKKVKAGD